MLDFDVLIDEQLLSCKSRLIVIEVYDACDAVNKSKIENSNHFKFLGKVTIPVDEIIYFKMSGQIYKMQKKIEIENGSQKFNSPPKHFDIMSAISS